MIKFHMQKMYFLVSCSLHFNCTGGIVLVLFLGLVVSDSERHQSLITERPAQIKAKIKILHLRSGAPPFKQDCCVGPFRSDPSPHPDPHIKALLSLDPTSDWVTPQVRRALLLLLLFLSISSFHIPLLSLNELWLNWLDFPEAVTLVLIWEQTGRNGRSGMLWEHCRV